MAEESMIIMRHEGCEIEAVDGIELFLSSRHFSNIETVELDCA